MLVEISNDFYEEILLLCSVLNITPGEYIERRCKHKENMKEILFNEREQFDKFVKEYNTILENLYPMTSELSAQLGKLKYSSGMDSAFARLTTLVGEDLSFLVRLYNVYKENNNEDYNEVGHRYLSLDKN